MENLLFEVTFLSITLTLVSDYYSYKKLQLHYEKLLL